MTNYREILRLSSLGLNKAQIAGACGCDYSALWKTTILLKENIDTRRGKRQFEPGTH